MGCSDEQFTQMLKGYGRVYSWESYGSGYCQITGIQVWIKVEGGLPDKSLGIVYSQTDKMMNDVNTSLVEMNPERRAKRAEVKSQLSELFPSPIYAEEIPNEYCSKACCFTLPWLLVTTSVGHFKIGWRKRVIHLDWEKTKVDKTAEELFPKEDTTKFGKAIHAWTMEKAKEYIKTVIDYSIEERK